MECIILLSIISDFATTMLLWVILPIILIYAIVRYMAKKEEEKIMQKKQAEEEIRKQEYEKTLADFSTKLGACTINENLSNNQYCDYSISTRILVYEQSSVIIIMSKKYQFSDILGYSLVDDATNETITTSTGAAKTSTGSMLGRAVVGGVLTGGLGAVAGAATAKKSIFNDTTSQTTTTHEYTLYINVNDLQEPTISLEIGDNTSKVQKIAGVLNIIIERNKRAKQ